MDKIRIDNQGYIYVDGVKVCQVKGRSLIFYDRNRKRARVRGAPLVEVDVMDLVRVVGSQPVAA